ncbi:MAG: hypothetical protein WDA00_07540 [Eubacteriales bacterium]
MTSLVSIYAAAASVDDIIVKAESYLGDIKAQLIVTRDLVNDLIGKVEIVADYIFVVVAALCLLVVFLGYKLRKLLYFIAGLVGGFAVGLFLFELLTTSMSLPDWLKWVAAGLLAVIGAFLLKFLARVAVVIAIGVYAFIRLGTYTDTLLVRAAITAAVVVLALFLYKAVFIHGIAYLAGVKCAQAVLGSELLSSLDLTKYVVGVNEAKLVLYVGILLAILGVWVQYSTTRRRSR